MSGSRLNVLQLTYSAPVVRLYLLLSDAAGSPTQHCVPTTPYRCCANTPYPTHALLWGNNTSQQADCEITYHLPEEAKFSPSSTGSVSLLPLLLSPCSFFPSHLPPLFPLLLLPSPLSFSSLLLLSPPSPRPFSSPHSPLSPSPPPLFSPSVPRRGLNYTVDEERPTKH